MKLEDIMTKDVITADPDDSLDSARRTFEETGFKHLVVVYEDRMVGVVSRLDVMCAISPFLDTLSERQQDCRTLRRRVHQVMTRDARTATRDTPVRRAARILLENNVSCLPIVSHDKAVDGIVSWRDILRSALFEAASP